MNEYYVYEWIRLDTNEPFYVGKGRNERWRRRDRGNNKHFNNIVKSIPCSVNILHDNLDENIAFDLECWYINEYKHVIGYDLCNITDGGEGGGLLGKDNPKSKMVVCLNNKKIFNTLTEASKYSNADINAISQCCYGKNKYSGTNDLGERLVWKFYDDFVLMKEYEMNEIIKIAKESGLGENNSFYNKHHSVETRKKLRQYNLGKKHSNETKRKLSDMRKGEGNNMYGRRGEDNPNWGLKRTDEQKQHLSELNGRKVKCIELDIVFSSLSKSEEYMKNKYNTKFNRRTLASRLCKFGNGTEYKEVYIDNEVVKLHWEYN